MKKKYFFFFLLILFLNITFSQQSVNEDVGLNLGKVRNNVTSGIKAFSLENLKYHAKISKSAIDIVERLLEHEKCYNAYDISNSISIYLETALLAEDFNSAQVYLKKAQGLINDAFYEYDICGTTESTVDVSEENAITNLQQQQLDLKKQQLELEQKAKTIQLQLAKRQEEEKLLEKEKFISENVKAINENIKTHNALLKSYRCDEVVIVYNKNTANLLAKNIEQIRAYFLDETIFVFETYIEKAKKCKQ